MVKNEDKLMIEFYWKFLDQRKSWQDRKHAFLVTENTRKAYTALSFVMKQSRLQSQPLILTTTMIA